MKPQWLLLQNKLDEKTAKLQAELDKCKEAIESGSVMYEDALKALAVSQDMLYECQRERDELILTLKNCIPTLEDVAQTLNNMVEFGLLPSMEYDITALNMKARVDKTISYINDNIDAVKE